MEKTIKSDASRVKSYTFKTHESYSPEEIIAAGGTTAFAHKIGKTYENMIAKLKETPLPIVDFTDEEWDIMMEQLKNDK
ncbi:MAG: hypothetical protein RLZZ306_2162 [Bacteroidota bacterium]|jgi:hypothetical protein